MLAKAGEGKSMDAKLLRQWEGGVIFAAILLGLDAVGIFCLILFAVKGAITAGLLLPLCMGIGLSYYVWHFFTLWRTAFLVSENGVTMINRKDTVRAFTWDEIKIIYIRAASDVPGRNDIVFASADIACINEPRKVKDDAGFLFWMAYTKHKDEVLSQYAESKIVRVSRLTK